MLLALALLACSGKGRSGAEAELFVEVSEQIGTVFLASWTSSLEDVESATILVETSSGRAWTVDASDGTATVWGVRPLDTVTFTLRLEGAGLKLDAEPVEATAGASSSQLPALSVEGATDTALDGGLLLTTSLVYPGAALVVDGDGTILWWGTITEDDQVARVRLSVDGEHFLGMPVNNLGDTDEGLKRLDLEGNVVESIAIEGMHHDFEELPDGTLAFTVRDEREIDRFTYTGDTIVEVTPDGEQSTVFNAWDALPFDPDSPYVIGGDWTHANAIDYLPDTDQYLLGLRGQNAIVAIDRASGEVDWVIGSRQSDFALPENDQEIFDLAHQFELLDGSILIFENSGEEVRSSGAVQFSFDPDEPVMREEWRYETRPSTYCFALGDVARLGNGNTLVDYSVNGTIIEVTPEGNVAWQLSTGLGTAVGYMEVLHGVAGH